MKIVLLFLLLWCADSAYGKEQTYRIKSVQQYSINSYQSTIISEQAKHEQLMEQARKDRTAQEAQWKKEYWDSQVVKRKIKQPIIGPVIGPYNNPGLPPHIMVEILSEMNK
jgi:hypothetical protein